MDRRDLLKTAGALYAAATLAGCEAPVGEEHSMDSDSSDWVYTETPTRARDRIRFGDPPHHQQASLGSVHEGEPETGISYADGTGVFGKVGMVTVEGIPHSLAPRGSRQEQWRRSFEAREITHTDWRPIRTVNLGFVSYPPNKVPLLRVMLHMEHESPTAHQTRFRVVHRRTDETVFHMATRPAEDVALDALDEDFMYEEWPLHELAYGTAGESRDFGDVAFRCEAKVTGGTGHIFDSSLGLDLEGV